MSNLYAAASKIRTKYFGNTINLCSIINAKSGDCSEDCSFCAQSSHYSCGVEEYALVSGEKIKEAATEAESWGSHIGVVTSGGCLDADTEFDKIVKEVSVLAAEGRRIDASIGFLDKEKAEKLKEVGLHTINHNLEACESYFPKIVSTHTYKERVTTIQNAKNAGLKACCGGILGLGESLEQRAELLFELADLDVDTIPLNFLNPIPGTPLANVKKISALDCLRVISLARFILPKKDIKICGGRTTNLGDLQSLIFLAGASGVMIGNYLTTVNRSPEQDLKMIKDLGFTIKSCSH